MIFNRTRITSQAKIFFVKGSLTVAIRLLVAALSLGSRRADTNKVHSTGPKTFSFLSKFIKINCLIVLQQQKPSSRPSEMDSRDQNLNGFCKLNYSSIPNLFSSVKFKVATNQSECFSNIHPTNLLFIRLTEPVK